jgi:hypothetical protein
MEPMNQRQDGSALFLQLLQSLLQRGVDSGYKNNLQEVLKGGTSTTMVGGQPTSYGANGIPDQLAQVTPRQSTDWNYVMQNATGNPFLDKLLANQHTRAGTELQVVQTQKLQQPEQFTLNPGDVRYSGTNPIAMGLPVKQTIKDEKVGERTGPDNNKYAMYMRPDKTTYEVKVGAERPPANTNAGLLPPGMITGQPLLEKYRKENPAYAKMLESVLNYKSDMTKLLSGRNAQVRNQFAQDITAIDPNYDMTEYPTRQKAMQYYTSGGGGTRVGQLNTVSGHLTQLDKAIDALKNNDVKLLNGIANTLKTQTGTSAPMVFESIKNAVKGEIAGLYKAGAGQASPTDPEMMEVGKTLDASLSGNITHDVVLSNVNLISSRMETEAQRYWAGTKKMDFYDRFLTPKAKDFYQHFLGQTPSFTEPTPGNEPPPAPTGKTRIIKLKSGKEIEVID